MGQTLTHGVYLPDEGERNCYSGLAANWQILDSAVGTVAEHTTALAGKAPLVHTHTKSDITDFPVYGNTAGTICEGNDSRLSDARTPVAHTHTKSDVTDLLNSNFIPSADTAYNIGSATYRWNSIWVGAFKSKSTNIDLTDSVTTGNKESWYFHSYDKNENSFFSFGNKRNHSAGSNEEHFRIKNASGKWADFYLKLTDSDEFSVALSMHSDVTNKGFRGKFTPTEHLLPAANNAYDLGSSNYKWKTLNGINPGALSLPKTDSSITAIEISGFSFDGANERIPDTVNIFSNGVALMNGWLCARIAEGAGHYIFLISDDNTGRYGICSSCFSSGIVTTLSFGINVYVPIKVGDKPAIRWAKPNGGNAQLVFYPCLGNV